MIEQIKKDLTEWDELITKRPELKGRCGNWPKWVQYLVGEVERLKERKCETCGGVGYVEVCRDPYATLPCECAMFEEAVEKYPKVLREVEELQKALEEQKELIDRIQKQVMWGDACQATWKVQKWIGEYQAMKGDETK